MMRITQQQIRALVERPQDTPSVSLFMPVDPNGPSVRKNPIVLKNLLKEARSELERLGAGSDEIEAIVEPLGELEKDENFWKHQSVGLAILSSPDETIRISADHPFCEECIVDRRFHVRPLLAALGGDTTYYVLSLSRGQVRLYRGGEDGLELMSTEIPESIEAALGAELERDSLQHHVVRNFVAGPSETRGNRGGVFHGHGVGQDDDKAELRQFMHHIDDGLMKAIGPTEPGGRVGQLPPLVIAGVQRNRIAFAEVSRYPDIVESGVDGDASKLPLDHLHRATWQLVQPRLRRDELEDRRRFEASKGGDQISTDLSGILRACQEGRVEALFAAVERPVWGTFDPDGRQMERHERRQEGDVDLVEEAAVRALEGGARVYGAPAGHVPGGGIVAAVFRF